MSYRCNEEIEHRQLFVVITLGYSRTLPMVVGAVLCPPQCALTAREGRGSGSRNYGVHLFGRTLLPQTEVPPSPTPLVVTGAHSHARLTLNSPNGV